MKIARAFVLSALSCLMAMAQSPRAETLVKKAIAYAQANGVEKLIAQTNSLDGRFHVGSGSEMYLYVYDLNGMMKANGFKTELVGKSRFDAKDPDGKFFVREFIKCAKTSGSGWVDYKYANPLDGKIELKTSYVELSEDLIFCCGTYKK